MYNKKAILNLVKDTELLFVFNQSNLWNKFYTVIVSCTV